MPRIIRDPKKVDAFGLPRRDPRVDEIHDALRALGRDPHNPTPEQVRDSEKFDRDLSKFAAEWDSMDVDARRAWAAAYSAAERRARDDDADTPTSPDRWRDLYSFDRYAERETRRAEKRRAAAIAEALKAEKARARAAAKGKADTAKVAPAWTEPTRPAGGPSVEIKPAQPRRRRLPPGVAWVQNPDGSRHYPIRDEDD